ncbi:hypothetical protein [Mesorhizobium shangrilense]|uniref:Uncharacterized protein n=1 Tax=Mesorhizobium shangrilense TaxID=460060 RepID=A0ABV2DS75_9HYPH
MTGQVKFRRKLLRGQFLRLMESPPAAVVAKDHDVYRSSHTLVVSAHPLLLSAFVLADSALPRGSAYWISGGY